MPEKTNQLSGFLIINKPAGITSHDVVAHVRRLLKVGLPAEASAKVGHAGTLDPFATGVLIVAIGKTTRLMEYAQDFSKTYTAQIILGATSDTDDLTGAITPVSSHQPNREEIIQALKSFTGPIQQIPPTYAAIKVKGKKLYEYARAGERVERIPRPVTIHALNLISYQYPQLEIEVSCSSGTYIRSLARDIGDNLGTGGYVSRLERKVIHKFHISTANDLSELSPINLTAALKPPAALVDHFPSLALSPENVAKWAQGRTVPVGSSLPPGSFVAVFNEKSELVGIGEISSTTSLLQPKKVL